MLKKFIKVIAIFNEDGSLIPITIIWEDNRKFSIDKVLSVSNHASIKYGTIGTRYICKVHGKEINLYNAENRWFLEKS